jgi:signal transduction histidine kinase
MAVKEAVHNAIKHSKASEVNLCVRFIEDVLAISVQDNGRGFELRDHSAGRGLNNMKRRLTDVGGICTIESQPGRGTLVKMRLAIRPVEE